MNKCTICSSGYKVNFIGTKCEKIPCYISNCKNCSSYTCYLCNSGYTLFSRQCVIQNAVGAFYFGVSWLICAFIYGFGMLICVKTRNYAELPLQLPTGNFKL